MEALLGNQAATELAMCMGSDQEMREIWEEGHVFANHFVRLNSVPDESTLKAAICRGSALFLPEKFPGAYILIPIMKKNRQMCCFIIQVKNRAYDLFSPNMECEAEGSLGAAARSLNLSAPIGMTMALRRRDPAGASFGIWQPPSNCQNGDDAPNYTWPAAGNPKKLWFLVSGLDKTIYPAVNMRNTKESDDLIPLLWKLLDCNAGISLPDDVDKLYSTRLATLG